MLRVVIIGEDVGWIAETRQILTASLTSAALVQSVSAIDSHQLGADYDVAVVDYRASAGNSSSFSQTLTSLHPSIDVIVCNVPSQTTKVIALLRNGVVGYVRSTEDPTRILQVVRALLDDTLVLDRDVAEHLVEAFRVHERLGRPI